MPTQVEGMKFYKNYDKYRVSLKNLVDAKSGNVFLDFSDDTISIHKKYFYNYSHLNSTGAKIFSSKLSIELKKAEKSTH